MTSSNLWSKPASAHPASASDPEAPGNSLGYRDRAAIENTARWVESKLVPYHRARVTGLERIPSGPACYVANHSGGPMLVDSFIFCATLFLTRGMDDFPYILTHDFAVSTPALGPWLMRFGALRATHQNARRVLDAGRKLLVYPGGDVEGLRPFRQRHKIRFGGHRGYIRMALDNCVPIVPVVSCGSHSTLIIIDDLPWLARRIGAHRFLRLHVWPLALSFPWGLTLGPPPPYLPFPSRIRIEVLDPIRFERDGPEAAADADWVAKCAERVEHAMQRALDALSKRSTPPAARDSTTNAM